MVSAKIKSFIKTDLLQFKCKKWCKMKKRAIQRIVYLLAIFVNLALFDFANNHANNQKGARLQTDYIENALLSSADNSLKNAKNCPGNLKFYNRSWKLIIIQHTVDFTNLEEKNSNILFP